MKGVSSAPGGEVNNAAKFGGKKMVRSQTVFN